MLCRLDCPAGFVCRLTKSPIVSLPLSITKYGQRVPLVLGLAWKTKVSLSLMSHPYLYS